MDLLFLALRTSIVVRFQQATAIHKDRCAERARCILPWTPSQRLRLPIGQDNVWSSQSVVLSKGFKHFTLTPINQPLAIWLWLPLQWELQIKGEAKYSEAQRLLGHEASSNATSVTSLTSRHRGHRGSRSHRHGAGHGHGGSHGFTSRGGCRCHSCSGSCSGFLRFATALQRQGGNEAEANGRERTDKLHDHKG